MVLDLVQNLLNTIKNLFSFWGDGWIY
jgi:hypothetical protein